MNMSVWQSEFSFFLFLYHLHCSISFSARLFIPKQPYVHCGSLALAIGLVLRLAVGLISMAWPDKHVHTHTQEMAGCASGTLGHLEQPEHKRVASTVPRLSTFSQRVCLLRHNLAIYLFKFTPWFCTRFRKLVIWNKNSYGVEMSL